MIQTTNRTHGAERLSGVIREGWTMRIYGMAAIAALMVISPADRVLAQAPAKAMKADRAVVDRIIAKWAARPRLGAVEMLAKYGAPQEATSERLIWHEAGPFKRVAVMNLETPHDFPLPHVDFLEHTITYNVPQDKVGALIEFDASSTINRTVGELSARCDLEGHNILTLNLDHDIVMGKKTVQEARTAFGEIVTEDVLGKHPAYVEALQFEPASMSAAAFPDKPVISGSPMRAAVAGSQPDATGARSDASVLATVIAVDLNEVLAAAEAGKKKISQPVLQYAKLLHEGHGENMVKTMKLGQEISVTPVITASVEQLQKKGAGGLATLVRLDGKPFERAYLAAMIKGHAEVVAMIDNQLLKSAENEAVKKHLIAARADVAGHLEKARALQAGLIR
ncbi:MAG: DUF4142 domain-containing protein [Anaerolineae bacterium]|nr:DUF4142 domain-containing protein [Gemmatimonadaceae bacterium]